MFLSQSHFLLLPSTAFLLLLVGCSSVGAENKKTPQMNSEKGSEIQMAQNDTGQQATAKSSAAVKGPEDAKRLAEQHVALRKRSWGVPKEVSEHDGIYWVSFDTPDQELRLLGPRIILIDKETGAASVQMRR